jgi:hypothetical protein
MELASFTALICLVLIWKIGTGAITPEDVGRVDQTMVLPDTIV